MSLATATAPSTGSENLFDVPSNGIDLRQELRTAGMVWQREIIRFVRNRSRIVSGLIQPLLFLFVLGIGLGQLVGSFGGFSFVEYMFPGIVSMSVVTTSIFSAISIVWDREFGFLREMIVAPVSRSALVLGKVAGGATVASVQGALMLILAPVIGVSLTPLIVAEMIGMSFLMAFMLTAFGVFVASYIKKMEGFQVIMQFLLFPMVFLGGTMFPLVGLPPWLTILSRIDPITYAVDAIRRTMYSNTALPPIVLSKYGNGVTVGGTLTMGGTLQAWSWKATLPVLRLSTAVYTLAIWQELAILVALGVLCTGLAVVGFSQKE
jgi:ABC-2 type transport system permease protein